MRKPSTSAAAALGACFVGLALSQAPAVTAPTSQPNDVIARVESGLLPPILWKGKPRTRMALADRMAQYQTPGVSLAVVDGGALAWARGWGVSRAGSQAGVTPDTLLQAGSLSKTVTALLTLRLAGQGRFGLDDPVNALLKSWKLPDSAEGGTQAVTVRHLLLHTAGLNPIIYPGVEPAGRIPGALELLPGTVSPPVPAAIRVEPPGTRVSYSNPGFLVLQQVLVDVTGKPFDELAEEELFAPLGLAGASFAPRLSAPLFDRAAWGHDERGQPLASKGLVFPAAIGGLWTTPSDLARLMGAFLGSYSGDSRALIAPALAREAAQARSDGQGLCSLIEGTGAARRLVQMGATPGFIAYLVAYPERRQAAVVMINSGGASGELARELMRSVADAYEWPGYLNEYELAALPPRAAEELAGLYEFDNPSYPKIQVTAREGRLYWADREMEAVAGGGFVLAEAGMEVQFVRDASGKVIAAEFRSPGTRKMRVRRTR